MELVILGLILSLIERLILCLIEVVVKYLSFIPPRRNIVSKVTEEQ